MSQSFRGHPSLEDAKSEAINRLSSLTKRRKATPAPVSTPKAKAVVAPKPPESTYIRSLKLNRSYEDYMKSFTSGTMPEVTAKPTAVAQGVDLFARDEEEERRKFQDRERLKRKLIKSGAKDAKKLRKISATKAVIPKDEPVWCARCNKKHEADFHKKEIKPRVMPCPSKPVYKAKTIEESSEDYSSDSSLASFIAPDDASTKAISQTIRSMFGYDPSKYVDDDDDRDMEADAAEIEAEERRTARIARREDEEELRKLMGKKHRE